jgi:hypothetical protein
VVRGRVGRGDGRKAGGDGGGILLKGGWRERHGGGAGELGDAWRVERGRKRGSGTAENGSGGWHRHPAGGTRVTRA